MPSIPGSPVTARAPASGGYTGALAVLASIFFMWGFTTVLNDILVPHLKAVFSLNYTQSLLIQFVFYFAYFAMSLPWAKLLERIGYKMSVVGGLVVMAAGALCFIPAAMLTSYGVFLLALFVLASGITLLQVAANPYVAVIGPEKSASGRLNLVQAFNSMGTMFAPLFGGFLILGRSVTGTATGGAAATAAQKVADAKLVELPYFAIAAVLVIIALIIWKIRLPDVSSENRREAKALRQTRSLWKHRNLVWGVPAIFIYLIAEIGVGSLLVNYISLPSIGNMSHAEASSHYLFLFWGGAMVGRFVGAGLMQKYRPEILLALVSIAAFALIMISVLTTGHLAMWTIILVGLCNSIMFPTIFTLGIKGLGPLTEEASGLLIMAIAGGALSDLQGVIADHYSLQISFLLPAVCYLYVLFYALWGSKPTHAETELAITG